MTGHLPNSAGQAALSQATSCGSPGRSVPGRTGWRLACSHSRSQASCHLRGPAFLPEVVIHEMTQIGALNNLRRFDRVFAVTNQLRTQGTDNLLAAATAAGARRLIAASFSGWTNSRTGGPVKTEADPLDANPPAAQRETAAAIRYPETAVTEASPVEGIVLRYGSFYGPGASDEFFGPIRKRKMPVVGDGAGIWSFIHVADAAAATVAALDHGSRGVYNVVDEEPAEVAEWLPYLAEVLGAKPPMHVPRLAGPADGRRGRRVDADPDPRFLQRQGESGTWLGACLDELAAGLPAGRRRAGRDGPRGRAIGTLGTVSVTEAFEGLRPLMFSIAYRMLGSVADAEDIVQEAFLRYHRVVTAGPGRARGGRRLAVHGVPAAAGAAQPDRAGRLPAA
jgi:nucleoside-diphosphate-sugar epimerase